MRILLFDRSILLHLLLGGGTYSALLCCQVECTHGTGDRRRVMLYHVYVPGTLRVYIESRERLRLP